MTELKKKNSVYNVLQLQLVKCLSAPTAQSKETNKIKINWLAHSYKTERNHGGFVSVEKIGNAEISSTKLSLSFSSKKRYQQLITMLPLTLHSLIRPFRLLSSVV